MPKFPEPETLTGRSRSLAPEALNSVNPGFGVYGLGFRKLEFILWVSAGQTGSRGAPEGFRGLLNNPQGLQPQGGGTEGTI